MTTYLLELSASKLKDLIRNKKYSITDIKLKKCAERKLQVYSKQYDIQMLG